jgi:hypothetical protein
MLGIRISGNLGLFGKTQVISGN